MSKADTLLKKAIFFEKMAIYSDRKTFLQALAQQTPIMEGQTPANPVMRPYGGSEAGNEWEAERQREFGKQRTIPAPQPLTPQEEAAAAMKGPADVTFKPDSIKAYAPIPQSVQEHLSSLVSLRGWGIPLHRIDGKIGPDTKAALDSFKSRSGLPANAPISQVFAKIESEYAKDHPPSYDFSSQVQQREQNRIRESTPPGVGVNAPKNNT